MTHLTTLKTLPLLDLSQLDGDARRRRAFLDDLRAAARDVGFFYLRGHGVDGALNVRLQHAARQFFALPEADKLAVQMVHSPHFRGYNRAAAELTRGQPDWREQFDIGAERPALTLSDDTPRWARLQGPNQWPAALPTLKPLLLQWQQAMTGFLSFLLQDEQKGLQVEVSEGRWIDAQPREDTFVVNIGELLELATNGYLRATVHRVETPPAGRDRLSIAFFLGARLDAVVPLYQLPPQLAAQARGPASDPLNPLLRDVGYNYLKGRIRSHPDVAQRFYRDVIGV